MNQGQNLKEKKKIGASNFEQCGLDDEENFASIAPAP